MKNSDTMKKVAILKSLLILIIISGLANCAYLLSIPADPKNSIIFGYSTSRLLLIGLLLIGTTISIFYFFRIQKTPQRFINIIIGLFQNPFWINIITLIFLLLMVISWLAFYSPIYYLGKYFSLFIRLRPILLFFQTISISLLLLTVIIKNNWNFYKNNANKTNRVIFIVTACIIFCISLAINFAYPQITDDYSWFGRYSVPILITQISISWVLITFFNQLFHGFNTRIPVFFIKNFDWIVFFFIWFCAGILWMSQPVEFMADSYVTTIEQHLRPFPPTYEIFPWKDSRTYYFDTEWMLIGENIKIFTDKPLFLAFESLNNWLSDGSYERMLNRNVWFLAFFPSIIYLLGKELHSRPAGLMGAALAVMQEINGIRIMDEFPVVSSKTLLSEPFVQLWTVIIALTAVIAFNDKSKNWKKWFLVCGGALGLSALIRLNTLIVIPFLLLILLVHFFRDKKALIKNASIFIIGVVLAFTPWMIYNKIEYDDPLAFIATKQNTINYRLNKITSYSDSQLFNFDIDSRDISTSTAFNSLFLLNSNAMIVNQEFSTVSNIDNYSSSDLLVNRENLKIDEIIKNLFERVDLFKLFDKFEELNIVSLSILRHFLNNIITSFSILPTSIIPQDLFHGSRNQRFWGGYDANLYEGINPILIVINLLILSIGISKIFYKNKIVGAVPFAVYFGYYLSNGIAFSSGNRYAQTVSWVILFYYSIGLMEISQWFLCKIDISTPHKKIVSTLPETKPKMKQKGLNAWFIILAILLVGSAPVAVETLPAHRFPEVDEELIAMTILENPGCQEELSIAGFVDGQEILNLLNIKGYTASIGRVLMPLQLNIEEYKLIFKTAGENLKTDDILLTFFYLEPKLNGTHIILNSRDQNINLFNRSDAMIIRVEGSKVAVIGVIDSNYASKTMSYDDLTNISFNCYVVDIY